MQCNDSVRDPAKPKKTKSSVRRLGIVWRRVLKEMDRWVKVDEVNRDNDHDEDDDDREIEEGASA